jgi:flagellar basal body-associated protein FliL
MEWLKKIGSWLKSIPSEPTGTGSASRVVLLLLLLLVATVCGVLIAFVAIQHTLPSKDVLEGLAALASVGMGSYGVNKWVTKDKQDAPAETPADPPAAGTSSEKG